MAISFLCDCLIIARLLPEDLMRTISKGFWLAEAAKVGSWCYFVLVAK
jgi:hypothetical protein